MKTTVPRKKPCSGDKKVDKNGVTWIRKCAVIKDGRGRVLGYDCTNGRQRYVWVKEGDVYP